VAYGSLTCKILVKFEATAKVDRFQDCFERENNVRVGLWGMTMLGAVYLTYNESLCTVQWLCSSSSMFCKVIFRNIYLSKESGVDFSCILWWVPWCVGGIIALWMT
jgi:hypothetical protein